MGGLVKMTPVNASHATRANSMRCDAMFSLMMTLYVGVQLRVYPSQCQSGLMCCMWAWGTTPAIVIDYSSEQRTPILSRTVELKLLCCSCKRTRMRVYRVR